MPVHRTEKTISQYVNSRGRVFVIYMNYKWNDKWIEESAASWAMNVSTPATNEATLLTASR